MSKRKTGYRAIHVSAGVFSDLNAAIREADAIKMWLLRLCARKGYKCSAYIGISVNNPRAGEVSRPKTGKRGRPKNKFVQSNTDVDPETEPHLHIIIHGIPAETIAQAISDHLNKKYKKRVSWVKNCSDYIETVLRYVIRQSMYVRTLDCFEAEDEERNRLLKSPDPNTAFLFTLSALHDLPIPPHILPIAAECTSKSELQCNIIIINERFEKTEDKNKKELKHKNSATILNLQPLFAHTNAICKNGNLTTAIPWATEAKSRDAPHHERHDKHLHLSVGAPS